ncbi:MAG: hypothetical protein PWQ45_143 [Thermosipho sp. (in: thermotogales)]|nr:hypothetical protein [Thermosipho sp. (in: thermotogales)]
MIYFYKYIDILIPERVQLKGREEIFRYDEEKDLVVKADIELEKISRKRNLIYKHELKKLKEFEIKFFNEITFLNMNDSMYMKNLEDFKWHLQKYNEEIRYSTVKRNYKVIIHGIKYVFEGISKRQMELLKKELDRVGFHGALLLQNLLTIRQKDLLKTDRKIILGKTKKYIPTPVYKKRRREHGI